MHHGHNVQDLNFNIDFTSVEKVEFKLVKKRVALFPTLRQLTKVYFFSRFTDTVKSLDGSSSTPKDLAEVQMESSENQIDTVTSFDSYTIGCDRCAEGPVSGPVSGPDRR